VSGLTTRFHAYSKSCAVTGSPLDHFASLRKSIVKVLPPLLSFGIAFATPGFALSFLSKVYNPSYTWLYISNETVSVAKAVSKEEISCGITFLNT